MMAGWRRGSSCHATTDIEEKIILQISPSVLERSQRAEPKHRQNTGKTSGTSSGGNIFAADVCAHTRIYTHTHTHTDKDTRTRSPTLTHTRRQAAVNVGHWALLSLKRAETVPNPPLQSGRFRTLRHKYSICPPLRPRYFTIKKPPRQSGPLLCIENPLTFPNDRQQPPCFAYLNVASRWWGPGGPGRKTGGLLHTTADRHAQ